VAAFVWRNRAPPRVQFFAWLLVRERIQSRENLKRRKVLEDAACEICASADETAAHIMFECEFAKSFWAALHIDLPSLITTAKLSELVPPQHIPAGHFDSFLLLCCWQLWKRRNNAVFRQQLDPLGAVNAMMHAHGGVDSRKKTCTLVCPGALSLNPQCKL